MKLVFVFSKIFSSWFLYGPSPTSARQALGILSKTGLILSICSVEGTNVIRVPFGKKFSKKKRPEKNQNIATLILPLSSYNNPTPPHVA